jgi:hypothetical protein
MLDAMLADANVVVTRVRINVSTGNRRNLPVLTEGGRLHRFTEWYEPCKWRRSSTVLWGTRGETPRGRSAKTKATAAELTTAGTFKDDIKAKAADWLWRLDHPSN